MPPAPTPNVLLIEDNRADVFLFQEALHQQGIAANLMHFGNGEDALRHLRRHAQDASGRPDLIVIDLHIPGLAGHEVLREIRREPALGCVPISIITGAPPEQVATVDLSGSDAFIHKSIDVGAYIEEIGRVVRRLCRVPLASPPSAAR
jgi:CheY-like chemotaxis protein